MGANTLLVEQNGYLGGAITACGVGPLATFHAGEKQVIGGITQELINQLKEARRIPWTFGRHLQFCLLFDACFSGGNEAGIRKDVSKGGR